MLVLQRLKGLFHCGVVYALKLLMLLWSWGCDRLRVVIEYDAFIFLDILFWAILLYFFFLLLVIFVFLAYKNLHIHGEASILEAKSLLAVIILNDFFLD